MERAAARTSRWQIFVSMSRNPLTSRAIRLGVSFFSKYRFKFFKHWLRELLKQTMFNFRWIFRADRWK